MVWTLGATCMCVVIISRGFHHMIENSVDAIKCLCNRMLFIIDDDTCVANEFRNSVALYAHRRFSCTTKIALSQCLLSSASIHSVSILFFSFNIFLGCQHLPLLLTKYLYSLERGTPSRLDAVAIVRMGKGECSASAGASVCLALIFGFLLRLFAIKLVWLVCMH